MSETTIKFSDLKLRKPIRKTLSQLGYEEPTPIQAESIPHILNGHDLIGCAQTGTGKTAAFALPILNYLDANRAPATPKMPRALVLSPTRELAVQISDSFKSYGQNMKFRHTVVYGGVSQHRQTKALNRGVHVLVATPGRLLDLMEQGFISLKFLEMFVLDEADRMLDMGFLPDLKKIIKTLPKERQSLFFSATMPHKVNQLAKSLLQDPVKVEVSPNSSTVEQINQRAILVPKNKKRDLLFHFLEESNFSSAIIFTRTKRGADQLSERLHKRKIKAEAIHGNKSQAARQRSLNNFKNGKVHVLVATDLAARGIDVEGITHVINYDIPQEPENYVHRIGRTGRAGAEGIAVTFCEPSDRRTFRDIERLIGIRIELEKCPNLPTPDQPKKKNEDSKQHDASSEGKNRGEGDGKPRRHHAATLNRQGDADDQPKRKFSKKPGKKDYRGGKKRANSSQTKSKFGNKLENPKGRKKKFKPKRKFRPKAAAKKRKR